MSVFGPSNYGFGQSGEVQEDLYAYVDHVAGGIARNIDSRTMLVDGSSIPVRNISLAHKKIIHLATQDVHSDAANKGYVDDRVARVKRYYVTVWAESKGPLSDGQFEWGFGGAVKYNRRSGYTMLVPGGIHKIGLSGGSENTDSEVHLVVNGVEKGEDFGIVKPPGQRSVVKRFTRPLYLNQGDVISLISKVKKGVVSDATSTVVTFLIELSM